MVYCGNCHQYYYRLFWIGTIGTFPIKPLSYIEILLSLLTFDYQFVKFIFVWSLGTSKSYWFWKYLTFHIKLFVKQDWYVMLRLVREKLIINVYFKVLVSRIIMSLWVYLCEISNCKTRLVQQKIPNSRIVNIPKGRLNVLLGLHKYFKRNSTWKKLNRKTN